MHQVICFGEILWDKLPQGKLPGGAPMNVALHLKKQGINSYLISSVGDDENGKELKHFLLNQGLPVTYLQEHNSLPTGLVDVRLDEHQQATYTIKAPVAWDEIRYQETFRKLVSNSDALVFGSLACRSKTSHTTLLQLLDKIKLAVFDMNLRPPHFEKKSLDELVKRCDILKLNEHELEYISELYQLNEKSDELRLKQLRLITNTDTICVTLGDKGAIVLHKNEFYSHPGFRIKVADTVGAGDAFLASFISNYLKKEPMEQTLIRACSAGALVASRPGANPDYAVDELVDFVKFNFTNQ
ncbi:MAG: carbohydrate kinase [Sphingobacteriaceae bacterium]|nr:carbohydrate kinase [Sphingobacteriaceae bacterium]